MSYNLEFKKSALREWNKLGHRIREQFKKKLKERLNNPPVPSSALSGAPNLYKIKLRQLGYRLVYSVDHDTIVVTIIAIGKETVMKFMISRYREYSRTRSYNILAFRATPGTSNVLVCYTCLISYLLDISDTDRFMIFLRIFSSISEILLI